MDYRTNLLFTVGNSAIFGVYFAVLGAFNKGIKNKGFKAVILLIIIFFLLSGAGFTDICIIFNIPFLINKDFNMYCSSSDITGYFFLGNILLLTGFLVISFIVANKRKRE